MEEVQGELRMFTFGHFMLSSIQQGIQAAHAITNMFTFYHRPDTSETASPEGEVLYSWANQHETIVCKNGGDTEALEDILTMLNVDDNYLPFHEFRESHGALNESITCVAIVVPERIFKDGITVVYSRNAEYKFFDGEHHYWLNETHYIYNEFEYNLIRLLRQCRHAQ